jgi:uncharacterized protein YjbI with pentapeptide repeats
MAEPSQQQQTTGQFSGKPPATPPLGEQSSDVSPSVISRSVTPSQLTVPPPGGQSSNTPQPVPPAQRKRRVIVTAVAAVLICLAGGGMLWQIGFAWYIAVLPILALILISLVVLGYIPRWSKYTGFGEYKSPYSKDQDAQRAKTVWDWLQLLIIPVILAAGALWFNYHQDQANIQASNRQYQNDVNIAATRYANDQQLAADQQREAALQAYLGQMSNLLLVDNLGKSKQGDEVRQVARARTLAVLRSLDSARKGYLLQFLYEANLINKNDMIVDLSLADLSDADLRFTTLSNADLTGADLTGADLTGADLTGADLTGADLFGADLTGAILSKANLILANLSKANLMLANLMLANLTGAILSKANLCHAKEVTQEQLQSALSLKGAIMPDCTKNQ